MAKVKIESTWIGDDFPCYTIAEAGANHDGKVDQALKLIDAGVESKTNSIKFQTYKAANLCTKSAPKYWDDDNENETQYDVFKKLDSFEKDDWRQIFEYARKKQVTCFSTPFDKESVELLYSLDVPAFKIASADITAIPLIKQIASKKLPIFISTGMASDEEINDAINTIEEQGNNQIVIMHCITSYPTKPEDANLGIIHRLVKKYPDYVIGYSDHTIGTAIPVYSTFYGAKCIEKHFTYDNNLKTSPDHWLSLNTEGFKQLVNELKISQISKGSESRVEFDSEREAVKFARRSIVSKAKIPKGVKITQEMLDIKRPGIGVPPKYFDKIIGSVALNDIEDDVPIMWKDVDFKP